MPTLLQRLRGMTVNDPAKRKLFFEAQKWARERSSDHVMHLDGVAVRLFPRGGLDAVVELTDAQLNEFMQQCVLAMLQYGYGFDGCNFPTQKQDSIRRILNRNTNQCIILK